ncbi:hypothetical protein REPUB_Repub11eG0067600 [Reevesia pubescens]
MASLHTTISPQSLLSLSKPRKPILRQVSASSLICSKLPESLTFSRSKQKKNSNKRATSVVVNSLAEELDVIPVQSEDVTDMQEGVVVSQVEREAEVGGELVGQVAGFGNEGRLSFEGFSSSGSASGSGFGDGEGGQEELERLIDRTINATIVLAAGTFAITKLLTIDHDYWQELFPFQDWWVVPAKVAFDQTAWSAIWNSIYFTVLGFLRLESPISIFKELKATFWPMLTAGWKLWPFAHLITYGVIPVEQRLLWVDCVELIWVTILSTYSNEKSEARISEAAPAEANSSLPVDPSEE